MGKSPFQPLEHGSRATAFPVLPVQAEAAHGQGLLLLSCPGLQPRWPLESATVSLDPQHRTLLLSSKGHGRQKAWWCL